MRQKAENITNYVGNFIYESGELSFILMPEGRIVLENSTNSANSFDKITTGWVQGITTSNGMKPYAPGGFANTGQAHVDINSGKADLIRAYANKPSLKNLPANFNLKSLPNIIYK